MSKNSHIEQIFKNKNVKHTFNEQNSEVNRKQQIETRENFKNLKFKFTKRTAQEIMKGIYYYFASLIEEEAKKNLPKALNIIKLSIYSLHELSQKLNLQSISISKASKINHIAREEIKLYLFLIIKLIQ